MKLLAGLMLAGPALAHVMSMSSGDLAIRGTHAHYELRLPLYEIPHVANPAESLLAHMAFASGGRAAQLLGHACHESPAAGSYICEADYQFAAPVDTLDVACTFYLVTVPNHVHLLRADNNGKHDQAIFDISFSKATLRFRPRTAFETAITQAGGGLVCALGGAVQILFLASLVLAAREGRELILLACMFLAGQIAAAVTVTHMLWQPPARFVEAAAALTIAYLAVEILFLPKAGMRWLIVAALGAFHGLYLALFVRTTGYSAKYVLAGAAGAEIIVIAVLALVLAQIGRRMAALKPVPVSAAILLVIGLSWFFLRLWS